jgi:hypothetical protein
VTPSPRKTRKRDSSNSSKSGSDDSERSDNERRPKRTPQIERDPDRKSAMKKLSKNRAIKKPKNSSKKRRFDK